MEIKDKISLDAFFGHKVDWPKRYQFEDYDSAIEPVKHVKKIKAWKWRNSTCTLLIQEDSLQRTLKVIEKSSFAILSAYRKTLAKDVNIARNRKLRSFLNKRHMGVHQLVGHWLEKQDDGTFAPAVERSYLVEKPAEMTDEEFKDIIASCLVIDGVEQDGAIIRMRSNGNDIFALNAKGELERVGSKLNFSKDAIKLAAAYSQHVKKLNTPFVFDGEEVPQTGIGTMLYKDEGFLYS